jgi:hypothetical protein
VYENDSGTLVACNDDACGVSNYQSELTLVALTFGNVYFIVVDGYGGECGDYILLVESLGPCIPECPPGGLAEGEPECHDAYLDETHGGCDSDPAVFSIIEPSDDPITICGQAGTYLFDGGSRRDVDWYEISPDFAGSITLTLEAEFDAQIALVDAGPGCGDITILADDSGSACETLSIETSLDAGTYWLVVVPGAFEGIPCSSEYVMTLEGYTPYAWCVDGEDRWTGSEDWRIDRFDLSDFMGEEVRIELQFGSDSATQAPGWYIAQVRVGHRAGMR